MASILINVNADTPPQEIIERISAIFQEMDLGVSVDRINDRLFLLCAGPQATAVVADTTDTGSVDSGTMDDLPSPAEMCTTDQLELGMGDTECAEPVSMCKILGMSSTSPVPVYMFQDEMSPVSRLMVKSCQPINSDTVIFNFHGSTYKFPIHRTPIGDPTNHANSARPHTDRDIRVCLSFNNINIPCVLRLVTTEANSTEHILIGQDLAHIIQQTDQQNNHEKIPT